MSTRTVAVNGRFLTMTATGVQRYAREILSRLQTHLDGRVRVILPPDRVLDADHEELDQIVVTERWHGLGGHRWEQLVLPRLFSRAEADVLWSPCNWGPLSVRRQVPVVHDIAPLTHPEYFGTAFRLLARTITGPLVRRSALVITPSSRVHGDLVARFDLDPATVLVVPPGVGAPFDKRDAADERERSGAPYCILVGASDTRKNADFLFALWPELHARTGLQLHVTQRSLVTTRRIHRLEQVSASWLVIHTDPTDEQLAALYSGALCLLWPSRYEGYGLPLLEAMAAGTPFISTDVGASRELAVAPEQQILPLNPQLWMEQVEAWHQNGSDDLRRASVQRAKGYTWDVAAAKTARVLDRLAELTWSRER
jgi:glycosyltransferase involved in cell wall biosynthesis